jgi:phytoene dehydrogenase-like protein
MTAWLPTIDANVATTNTGQNTGSARLKKISTANQYQKDYDDPSEAFNLWIGRVHLEWMRRSSGKYHHGFWTKKQLAHNRPIASMDTQLL